MVDLERSRLHLFERTEARVEALERASAVRCGVIASRTAADGHLSSRTVAALVDSGRWRDEGGGVFVVDAIDGGPLRPAHVALARAQPDAFLRLRGAALVLGGLDLPTPASIDVAVPPTSSGRRYPRIAIPPQHLICVDGLRTTDGLQTLLDLASVLDDTQWEWALEAAMRSRHVRLDDVHLALASPGRKRAASVRRVRGVLGARGDVVATDSLLETRFVQLCRRFGIPTPQRQVEVLLPGRRAYADFAWPDVGVFAELDGEGHKDQPRYDASRETAIVAATGWIPCRFTWTEVVRNPTPTSRRLRAVLEQAGRRPLV